ncbi:hypothetical protein H5410_017072 [Solanum commersonii]|uniref:LOB domain-containing protein n=1 Tax=Solanum commersonii TaxID=4109 RepID=A0A9J5ZYC6_SOLCO|nr:hypothetical protein H5410_017072 [Solanum commersonii]
MSSKRCAACKQLRRRCPSDCIFLPYFPPNNPQRFSFVHRIYGASNVGKLLQQVQEHQRADVADSFILHQEINRLERELAKVQAEISLVKGQTQIEGQLAQGQQVELSSSFDLSTTTPWFY